MSGAIHFIQAETLLAMAFRQSRQVLQALNYSHQIQRGTSISGRSALLS